MDKNYDKLKVGNFDKFIFYWSFIFIVEIYFGYRDLRFICRWIFLCLMVLGLEIWSLFCRNIKKYIRVWSFMIVFKCLFCRE